ncbi:hypothetical protein EV294_11618 [Paenibacillus sp. BK033]|uniref:hypothetical protein n=1 Tax=Paenibacillus sp. BK033 TaxID=2512133 RepID=UPI001042CD43|nr:hypothetical protein [Paenibacillus sp. BK033]TCM87937.1 hypothetical protein EV294_11618 [Paenibacillus sp. BK033]
MGQSDFKPIGMKIIYPWVDLENKLVEARIEQEGNIKMEVITDLKTGEQNQEGNWDDIIQLSPSMTEEDYLKMFQEWASVFIENGISNPKQYFEQYQ